MSQKLSVKAQSFFWAALGILFIIVAVLFHNMLLPFVMGAIIAYLLNPLVRILGVRGLPRWVSSLLILGIFLAVLAGIVALIAPLLVRELGDFLTHLPEYSQRVSDAVKTRLNIIEAKTGVDFVNKIHGSIQDDLGKALQMSQKVMGNVAAGILMGGSAIIGFLTTTLLIPIVAYFMMKDWPRITGFVHNLIPKAHKSTVNSLLDQMDYKISGFIRGQLSVCAILGGMYAVALSLAGLEYGALIGLTTGILSVIPYVGSTLGLLVSVGVAALQTSGDLAYVGLIAVIFFTGQFIEGNFITPKLIGNSVGLHPLWIIFALMAGGSLLGLTGMLMAVPLAAIISVLIGFVIGQYKNSDFYKTPDSQPGVILNINDAPNTEIIRIETVTTTTETILSPDA